MLPAIPRLPTTVPTVIALLAASALLAPTLRPPDPVPVLKLKGTMVTEERGNMLYDGLSATSLGARLPSMPEVLGQVADGLEGALRSQADGLMPGLLDASGLGDLIPGGETVRDETANALDDLEDSGGLKTSTQDFEVTIADGRMRMDQGTNSMIIRTDLDADAVMFWFIDRAEKRIIPVRASRAALAGVVTRSRHGGMDVSGPSGTESILGHQAARYTFGFETSSSPLGMAGAPTGGNGDPAIEALVENEGTAWLAAGVDGAEDVASFYRSFADAMGTLEASSGMVSGFASGMADLAELGMPLRVIQETTVRLKGEIEGHVQDDVMAWTRSTSTIEGITRDQVEEDFFDPDGEAFGDYETVAMPGMAMGGGDGTRGPGVGDGEARVVEEGCDCSCAAFAALQEMSKDKKAMENNPDAMKMAMCARECAMKWVACAR